MATSIDRLRDIVARLRGPDGCPWDREQTHQTLKAHLLEECYELMDAIDEGDTAHLQEELGDLLLQVVLHSQMAAEEGRFDLDSVAEAISDKLVRRHPHVFGPNRLPDSEAVLKQWDVIKRDEKQERKSIMDGIPKALPALAHAQKLQTRAARIGFDWNKAAEALVKVREEVEEIHRASADVVAEEIGDLLFAVVNFARKKDLDSEQVLEAANTKFRRRFQSMEQLARDRGLDLGSLTLTEMDQLWDEVKAQKLVRANDS